MSGDGKDAHEDATRRFTFGASEQDDRGGCPNAGWPVTTRVEI
jgi:hypothetical protein